MNRPLRIFDLLFSSGRERWSNNLIVKLGLGCVSVICLMCVCSGCFLLWVLTSDWNQVLFPFSPIIFQPTRGALIISPDSLPSARVEQEYSAKISVLQNETPVGGFHISSGELPAGITLEQIASEDTALLSGIPEQPGAYSFTVSVWCYGTSISGQTGQQKYELLVEE
ncbi:MAG: Ig domain-containing protein [Anaerolineae bacterium]|nr:Ig domain-containing protein [Anaerolineae bacterium]